MLQLSKGDNKGVEAVIPRNQLLDEPFCHVPFPPELSMQALLILPSRCLASMIGDDPYEALVAFHVMNFLRVAA